MCACIKTDKNKTVDNHVIQACSKFKYLLKNQSDTKARIVMGKESTKAQHDILWNENITKQTKKYKHKVLCGNSSKQDNNSGIIFNKENQEG